MDQYLRGAEAITLFCRAHMNMKRELPIRASEMGFLIFLVNNKEPATPHDAARFFRISKPMVAAMIRVLENKDYLTKNPSAFDGRSFTLCATKKAELLVEETFQEYVKNIKLLWLKMGSSDYEKLIDLLEKANQILVEGNANG
jgi:DNA-binding MarR family transcriptional regulator